MDNDREQLIEIMTAAQVCNKALYEVILQQSPLLAKFMMDKFKAFLNDEYITDIERQTLFMKFLQSHDNYEIIRDVLEFVQNECDLNSDYTQVIMEWTYHNSESLLYQSLDKYDGRELAQPIKTDNYLDLPITHKILNALKTAHNGQEKVKSKSDIDNFLAILLADIPPGPIEITEIDENGNPINDSTIIIDNQENTKKKKKGNSDGEEEEG